MMFEVEVGGRTFSVAVERTDRAGRFRLTLDGVTRLIDASRTGQFGLSLLERGTVPLGDTGARFSPDAPENVTVLLLVPGNGLGELLVVLGGRTIGATVNGRRSAHTEGARHGDGQVTIVAPMPGRVVRVLAAAGDEVEARQPVIVVEAMKMENELRAPRAGRIREIVVAPGTSVEAGRILAVIE
jgi:multidrug efflux pump subunit AcrA (membrane-fusion protein)